MNECGNKISINIEFANTVVASMKIMQQSTPSMSSLFRADCKVNELI